MARVNGRSVSGDPAARAGRLPGGYPRPVRAPFAAQCAPAHSACSTAMPAVKPLLAAYRETYRSLHTVRRELNELRQAEAGAGPADRPARRTRLRRSKRPASSRAKRRNCARSATGWPTPKTWPRWPGRPGPAGRRQPGNSRHYRPARAGGAGAVLAQPDRPGQRSPATRRKPPLEILVRADRATCRITWKRSNSTRAAWNRLKSAWI